MVLGVAVGIASYTAPLYLSEMASENVRRKMIEYVSADGPPLACAGVSFRYTAFSYSGNWRAMLGVLALPAVILIILVVFEQPALAGGEGTPYRSGRSAADAARYLGKRRATSSC
ncbi:sugar porter family MFS transporter [Klebsiella pneumoniae]|nr:sugar porter family MFS transporter [Klebsiella pneumoniae]